MDGVTLGKVTGDIGHCVPVRGNCVPRQGLCTYTGTVDHGRSLRNNEWRFSFDAEGLKQSQFSPRRKPCPAESENRNSIHTAIASEQGWMSHAWARLAARQDANKANIVPATRLRHDQEFPAKLTAHRLTSSPPTGLQAYCPQASLTNSSLPKSTLPTRGRTASPAGRTVLPRPCGLAIRGPTSLLRLCVDLEQCRRHAAPDSPRESALRQLAPHWSRADSGAMQIQAPCRFRSHAGSSPMPV